MPIGITGEFEPSDGVHGFDLYDPQDIKAGNVNVVLQAIAGGAFKGGSHATTPVGEVVAQVKTTTGAPTHSATEGTICWNSVDDTLHVNNNGTTGWTEIGAGGGGAPTDATYIVQTANATLTNEQILADLATGLLKNTTTTGVLTIAVSNTDYAAAVHASRHQNGGSDEIASATPGANAIPKANAAGNLVPEWFDLLPIGVGGTGVATYAASQLVRCNAAGTALESSGKVVPTGTIVGTTDTQTLSNKIFSNTITSTLAVGTKPLTVTSTTMCDNLNADTVDGSHASAFQPVDATLTELAGNSYTGTSGSAVVLATGPTLTDPVFAASAQIPNGAGGTTLNAAGEVCVDSTSKTLNFHSDAEYALNPKFLKPYTLDFPHEAEDETLWHTPVAIAIRRIFAVLTGSSTPSVTWTIRFASDRSAAGTEVVTGGTATTSLTGVTIDSFSDATIPADNWIWLETTAASGIVKSLHLTIEATQDP